MGYAGDAAMTPIGFSGSAAVRRGEALMRSRRKPILPLVFGFVAIAGELLGVAVATAVACLAPDPAHLLPGGAVLWLCTVAVGLARGDYAAETVLGAASPVRRALETWLFAVALAAVAGSVIQDMHGVDALLVLAGAILLPVERSLLARQARRWASAGRIHGRRVMLVGDAQQIAAFAATQAMGLWPAGAAVLRDDPATLADDLALAVAAARMRRPDILLLLMPWSEPARIARCIEALELLPAAIHLGPPNLEGHGRFGAQATSGVVLVKPPLAPAERLLKRAFDLTAAAAALVLLAPVFCAVAVAIKFDSRGPVFFRQRRTGYNGQPFRILKFRSMRTMEDGAGLRQVTRRDSRVTRVGRVLRRSSLDELPQLVNVLRGEMSLVGPRPHALAHDLAFGQTNGRYRRRHAVRPGITGWAQVSGFRGETDTAEKIEGRVRHDLAYVDHWSLRFDLAILLRTVFSPKTFHNAR